METCYNKYYTNWNLTTFALFSISWQGTLCERVKVYASDHHAVKAYSGMEVKLHVCKGKTNGDGRSFLRSSLSKNILRLNFCLETESF